MTKNRRDRRKEKSLNRKLAPNELAQKIFNEALQFHKAGRIADAEPRYRKVLELDSNHAGALNLLGVVFSQKGRPAIAIELIGKAVMLKPNDAVFQNNLGSAYRDLGQWANAETHYQRAIELDRYYLDALSNLGAILQIRGRPDLAMDCYRRALMIKPEHPGTHFNLGNHFLEQGRYAEAEGMFRRACELHPGFADGHLNLGRSLKDQGKFDEALAQYKKALDLKPNFASALNNIGSILLGQGKLDEGLRYYRRAIEISPDFSMIYSNLLLAMIYAESVPPEMLADTAREFGRRTEPLFRAQAFEHGRNPDRKLRVGYVSPDFRNHAVHYFVEPLLNFHNRKDFEIFGYSNVLLEDYVTERMRKKFDHWRNIRILDDTEAVKLIESDKIDILVDLTGHTGENRLLVFARKPAPIQMAWLGFPATTGMRSMDYRITDGYAEPDGMTEHLNTEMLWRLPQTFCCYQPHENSPAVIGHPPFEENGYITFGCFNNFAKVTDPVLRTWAEIMAKVPDSRLLLEIRGVDTEAFRAEVTGRLSLMGLPVDRVILEPRRRENQFVLYNRIDIALDPFPCVGGTTSFDTLWMGVPLVTLAGRQFVSRMGVSILTNAGMPELIANSTEEYVNISVELARDKERLRALRRDLRERVQKSPLMDQESFTYNFEDALRQMWRRYCAQTETPA